GSVRKISSALKCNPIIASILINRNIVSVEDAFDFLNPSFNNMRSPFSIKGINTAVSRIYSAIINNEKILIFGDYDVDGITATTILLEFFSYRIRSAKKPYYRLCAAKRNKPYNNCGLRVQQL
ncbi:MAG: hypothetical protein JRI62_08625, partial [Deltaproteobacteria bacterium]|nr:hypothetical protein [Deltaproteobacteria bacterium]